MLTRILAALFLTTGLVAQAPPDIAQYRRTLQAHLQNLKNYTCNVTIERSRKKSRKAAFEEADRVRIDVGYIDGRELFGWPGGESMDEADVARLVSGTIGNGDFALSARTLLTLPQTAFESSQANTGYSFSVPADSSDWTVLTTDGQMQVGYTGAVQFDAQSGSLFRLQITTSGKSLQPLGFARVTKTMQYTLSRDATGRAQLLPENAELHVVESNGAEAMNLTRFQACRLFSAESKLIEAQSPESNAVQTSTGASAATAAMPSVFEIPVTLLSAIDSARSAVGDLVQLRVEADVRNRAEIAIKKGDIATARISRLEAVDGTRHLEFMVLAVEAQGKRIPLHNRNNLLGRKVERGGFVANMRVEPRATESAVSSVELLPITTKARLELPEGTRLTLRSAVR